MTFKSGRGGPRVAGKGKKIGAPAQDESLRRVMVSIRLPRWLAAWLKKRPESQGRLIEDALVKSYDIKDTRIRIVEGIVSFKPK